jgi:hypothetical protein
LWRIGPHHFDTQRTPGEARGLVERIDEYTGIDTARVHPAIVPFIEDTASLELLIRSRWHFPFSLVWRLGRRVMRWIGQFVYPLAEGRIFTRVFPIAGAHAVIRTYDDGGAMQSVAYDVWRGAMRARFPLPGGHLRGVLRMMPVGEDDTGKLAVVMTSRPRGAGVWLVLGNRLPIPAPLGEEMALWAAGTSCVPAEHRDDPLGGATIVGRHVQRVFGIRFATHHYWFRKWTPSLAAPTISEASARQVD